MYQLSGIGRMDTNKSVLQINTDLIQVKPLHSCYPYAMCLQQAGVSSYDTLAMVTLSTLAFLQ